MDYEARMKEARKLIDQGMYTQAVMTLGTVMENLYSDFYQELKTVLPPAKLKSLAQWETDFTSRGDRNAREQGFAGMSLGGKAKFFDDYKVIEMAEEASGKTFKHFYAFDPDLFIKIRNFTTHKDLVVSEDESHLYYSQMRVLLVEVGLLRKVEAVAPMVDTGGIRSWKENGVVPHDDILGGNLQMDTYAADLWGVARNDPNTPAVYREADQFFAQTYLTNALRALLSDVLSVLGGKPGDRVLQLRTPFGGGKTHSLIALYHITKNRARLKADPMFRDLPDPGTCAVAAIQCEKFGTRTGRHTNDGLHLHTLWGELAYQLGGKAAYETIRVYDEGKTTPGGEDISNILRDLKKPALILLDEVLNHILEAEGVHVGESTLGRQLLIFIKKLTEAVAGSGNTVLVYSLQASVSEAMGAENLLQTLDHLVSRLDAKREPVTGDEVVCVVQRRLFKDLGSEDAARQVAIAYAEAYKKSRQAAGSLSADDQRRAAQEAERMADRILQSYPFHPNLLDLMYHRWGALPSYQRTRGALQFLASVVYDLWENGRDLQPLIGPGDVPLEMDYTRNAFFTQVGQREHYSSVLSADLVGENARAKLVDARMASDSPVLQRFRVGTRLSTAVMLYSFGAREGEDRGVSEIDLVSAAITPGLDRLPLITALNDLKQDMLYLHYTGRRYRFETQPNLNKLIEDEKSKFSGDDVNRHIEARLKKVLEGASGAVVWPADSGKVIDRTPKLQVAYLGFEPWAALTDDRLREALSEWLEFAGSERRSYKNAVAFAVPGYMIADAATSSAREALAIDSLLRDYRKLGINEDQRAELKERSGLVNDRLTNNVSNLYERVAVPVSARAEEGGGQPYIWRVLELQSRSEPNPHSRIMAALEDTHHVFRTVTVDKLVALTHLTESVVLGTGTIVGGFFCHYDFTRLISIDAIRKTIADGVVAGKFGYSAVAEFDGDGKISFPSPNLVYVGRSLRPDEIDLDGAYLLEAAYAKEASRVVGPNPDPPLPPDGTGTGGTGPTPPPPPPPPPVRTKRRYTLTATVDKGRANKVFKAINNLGDRSDRMHIRISVEAESDAGFDAGWLRNAVEEVLDEANVDAQGQLE